MRMRYPCQGGTWLFLAAWVSCCLTSKAELSCPHVAHQSQLLVCCAGLFSALSLHFLDFLFGPCLLFAGQTLNVCWCAFLFAGGSCKSHDRSEQLKGKGRRQAGLLPFLGRIFGALGRFISTHSLLGCTTADIEMGACAFL